jgi:hypothetical protein
MRQRCFGLRNFCWRTVFPLLPLDTYPLTTTTHRCGFAKFGKHSRIPWQIHPSGRQPTAIGYESIAPKNGHVASPIRWFPCRGLDKLRRRRQLLQPIGRDKVTRSIRHCRSKGDNMPFTELGVEDLVLDLANKHQTRLHIGFSITFMWYSSMERCHRYNWLIHSPHISSNLQLPSASF